MSDKARARLEMIAYGGAADPGADDVLAGGEDVDDRSVVGEGCASIGDRSSTDSVGTGSAGRGCGSSINVRVSSSDLNESFQQRPHEGEQNTDRNMNSSIGELQRQNEV
jgi:hypothetical protein